MNFNICVKNVIIISFNFFLSLLRRFVKFFLLLVSKICIYAWLLFKYKNPKFHTIKSLSIYESESE